MSRKLITFVLALISGFLAVLQTEFGLALNVAGLISFVVLAAAYIKFEAARDLRLLQSQAYKWRDPKWLTVVAGVIITAANKAFGLNLPVDIINGFLFLVLGYLFKTKVAID